MDKSDLLQDASSQFQLQSYSREPVIEGVLLRELNCFVDDGGYFLELSRLSQGMSEQFAGFEAKQVNYSRVLPGAVKAFHLHLHQEDIWFVPPHERALVVLTDQRKSSPTAGVTMRLVLGEGKSRLLYIPRGVAHGVANPWTEPVSVMYLVNQQFDAGTPDEGRIPWDFLGKSIWDIAKG
jgi:dTDP-4-dehydrorhamnose 3,5-epimerase